MINYLIESSVCLVVFYGFYLLFLQRDTYFERNRYYLLFSALFSVIIPLLEFSFWESYDENMTTIFITLDTEITPNNVESFPYFQWIAIGYVIVVTFFLIKLTVRVFRIFSKAKQFKTISKKGYQLVLTDGKLPTFTFLHFLFWDNKSELEKNEADKIIQHELAHIRGRHSIDILMIEIMKSVLWFNPVVYLLRSALSEQHEYIADAKVLKRSDAKSYRSLLVSSFLNNMNLQLIHSFNQPPIKKRIAMMNKSKTPVFSNFKLLMVLPLATLLFLAYACADATIEEPFDKKQKVVELETKKTIDINSEQIFEIVEQPAAPTGGIQSFLIDYIANEIEYPSEAKEKGVEGKVYVQFVITKDGSPTNVEVVRGIGSGCDEEVARVIKNMPDWNPGRQRGEAVNQRIVLPVKFELDD